MGGNSKQQEDGDASARVPASKGNQHRQAISRLNITHPVTWHDENLERAYNVKRQTAKRNRSELKRLHQSDE